MEKLPNLVLAMIIEKIDFYDWYNLNLVCKVLTARLRKLEDSIFVPKHLTTHDEELLRSYQRKKIYKTFPNGIMHGLYHCLETKKKCVRTKLNKRNYSSYISVDTSIMWYKGRKHGTEVVKKTRYYRLSRKWGEKNIIQYFCEWNNGLKHGTEIKIDDGYSSNTGWSVDYFREIKWNNGKKHGREEVYIINSYDEKVTYHIIHWKNGEKRGIEITFKPKKEMKNKSVMWIHPRDLKIKKKIKW